MSNVADRLRLLQRQAGRRPTGVAQTSAPTLREQLRRLMTRRQRSQRVLEAPAGEKLSDGLYAVEHRRPCAGARDFHFPWSDEGAIPRERFVCFDTDTTGLAGGVGTKAFMIGTTQWCGAELITRQLYLTALVGEAAMLDAFANALPEDAILVSYNGRSYDAPLLKGRYRMHHQQYPFEARTHLDLLHPTRRAYRGRWKNCRLVTIERHLLGISSASTERRPAGGTSASRLACVSSWPRKHTPWACAGPPSIGPRDVGNAAAAFCAEAFKRSDP